MLAVGTIEALPIADESVDLIFTDPPYPTRFLHVYEWLAREAMRVLRPGGWCVCMAGGLNLNVIFRMFDDAGLRYFYTMALKTPRQAPVVWRHVGGKSYPIVARVKHLLVYSKGEAVPRMGGVMNLYESLRWGESKRWHYWGQDVDTCRYYIEYFSGPGDVVLDPFVGGGTTLVAARLVDRIGVGIDVDPAAVSRAAERIAGVDLPLNVPLFPA